MASQSNDNTPPPSADGTSERNDSPAFEEVTGVTNTDFADAFDQAKDAVLQALDSEQAWQQLEQVGKITGRVEEVAETYRQALQQPLEPAVLEQLATQAVAYHDEWLDDPKIVKDLLLQVLTISPTAYWALERVSVLLTVESAWDELLSCYDRAIEACTSDDDRVGFLEEASSVAKDLAGDTSKAIEYLQQLFKLQPSERQVVSSLERLYRHENRFSDLVAMWQQLIPISTPKVAGTLRLKEATCWLEDLNEPEKSLQIAEGLLADKNTFESAVTLLIQVIGSTISDAQTRKQAIDLLGSKLDESDQWRRLLDAVEASLPHVPAEEALSLRGEIIGRLASHDDTENVIKHLAVVVAFRPSEWTEEQVAGLLGGEIDKDIFGVTIQMDPAQAHGLVHKAAIIALDEADNWDRAVALYQQILSARPDDLEAIEQLSKLYAEANRSNDLLALRQHELSLEENQERRLQLRLEVASLLQTLERSDDACKELRANLEELPGHRPSVEALSRILRTRERFEELTTMLSEQASVVQDAGDEFEAANLWMQAARVADEQLHDQGKAMDHYARVVALQPNTKALDALARIHSDREEPHLAVGWLEKRLSLTATEEQEDTVVQLARAYQLAGQRPKAIEHLTAGLQNQPDSTVLRDQLADIYRSQASWHDLVSVLLEGASHVEDTARKFQYLQNAAAVYQHDLKDPTSAIPVLRQAVEISPADRGIRTDLADALRASGELEEARRLAEGLIEEFGRRHPPQRAKLHLLLAQILDSEGSHEEALRQLEKASSMDVGNIAVQHMLARMYLEAGTLDKAERTYRALLLLLRRSRLRRSKESGAVDAGVAETLFELYRIASQRGDTDRAEENLASAFDAATRNLDEAIRFERAIRRANDTELLQRALRQRLDLAETPMERASILTDMSSLLAESLGRSEEALSAIFDAMKQAPHSQDVFDRARNLAKTLDALGPLVELLQRLAEEAEQDGKDELACTLYLRLQTIEAQDRHNLSRAKDLLEAANRTHVLHALVWLAQAALAREMNDEDGERDSLENILTLDDDEISAEDRIDTLGRLIALQLRHEATLEQGLETMREAIEQGWSIEQAVTLLEERMISFPDNAMLIEQLEQLCRKLDDPTRLFGVLAHRCMRFDVSQRLIQEAITLGESSEDEQRTQELLERAVLLAEREEETGQSALWAIEKLAEISKQHQRWENAVQWLLRAADLVSEVQGRGLRVEAAELAWKELEDFEKATDIFEMLLKADPSDESAWAPLMQLLEQRGEKTRLVALLSQTAEALTDDAQRIMLRTKRASLLLDIPGSEDEAIAELDKILAEAPDNADAADLSIRLLRDQGKTDELVNLLRHQLELAHEQKLEERGANLGHQLAEQLANSSSAEALEVYRSCVTWTARHEAFLRGYAALLQEDNDAQERAQVIERLLLDSSIPDATDLALDLVEARELQGDMAKLEEALEQAFAIAPDHTRTLSYFEAFAERLEQQASEAEDLDEASATFVKAADVYTSRLNDLEAAAEALGKAVEKRPADHDLLARLIEALLEVGHQQDAVDRLTAALEATEPGSEESTKLLVDRSNVWKRIGEYQSAVQDMQAAREIVGETLIPDLRDLLIDYRDASIERIDGEGERYATLALADLEIELGNDEQAGEALSSWVERNTDDVDAIRRLLDLERKASNWERIFDLTSRLVDLEDGEARVNAGVELAQACMKLDRFDEAKETLEMLYRDMPDNVQVRTQLRELYEKTEAHQELAGILLVDAKEEQDPEARFALLKRAGEMRLKDPDQLAQAIGPLAEAYAIHPDDNPTTLMLVDAYIDTDMIAEAVEILQGAMEQYGGRRSRELAALQRRMAHAASKSDRYTEMQWLQAAFETYSQDMQTAAELADLATQLEEYELAVKALRTLATAKGDAPISRALAFLKQAQIANIQQDTRKATFLAKKAISLDSELEEARTLLDSLTAR